MNHEIYLYRNLNMIFKLDITWHTTNQMISALIYKRIKDLLIIRWRIELFNYIKSVRILWNKLTIKTDNPIVNSELKLLQEDIVDIFSIVLNNFWQPLPDLKIAFK